MGKLRLFILPGIIAVIALIGVYIYLGFAAFLTAALLSVLEITLSFDNAVVNAKVLRKMSAVWQKRFLTWGVVIAVVGARLILPILIVSLVVWVSPWSVALLALFDPASYANLVQGSEVAIHSFGAAFLIMVSLKYFFDTAKTEHWIKGIERKLAEWGKIESIEIVLTLIAIGLFAFFAPHTESFTVLIAGVIGIILFVLMESVIGIFSVESEGRASHGLALFVYVNILNTAFSLDSVVGAFALTSVIPVIVVGLGIGTYFVQSLTVYMVREHTLETLKYLEHGAHWAIFGLAVSMFASIITTVPEVITGGVGVVFVVAAYWSSLRLKS